MPSIILYSYIISIAFPDSKRQSTFSIQCQKKGHPNKAWNIKVSFYEGNL